MFCVLLRTWITFCRDVNLCIEFGIYNYMYIHIYDVLVLPFCILFPYDNWYFSSLGPKTCSSYNSRKIVE